MHGHFYKCPTHVSKRKVFFLIPKTAYAYKKQQ